MFFLYAIAAVALAYLAGGLLTTVAAAFILWSQSRKITGRDLAVLPKVFVVWPAVVGMGVVFAVITIAQRWHFAQEAKEAAKKSSTAESRLAHQEQSPNVRHPRP